MNIEEKVSIVIPVYNAEKYLHRCIQSILQQTYPNWVAIFVNDGSTDSSLRILQEYANNDNRFKIINKTNGGASSARNVGIEAVETRFLTFVDADDSILPTLIERLLNTAVTQNCNYVATALRFKGKDCSMPVSGEISVASDAFFLYVNKGPYAKLFNKEIIDQYSLRFAEDLMISEDYLFTTSYAVLVQYIYIIPETLYHYHFDSQESLIHRAGNRELPFEAYCSGFVAPWRAYQLLLNFAPANGRGFTAGFSFGLYKDMWSFFNLFFPLSDDSDKTRMKLMFRQKRADFSQHVSFAKRITCLARYPRLHAFLRRVKNAIKEGLKMPVSKHLSFLA